MTASFISESLPTETKLCIATLNFEITCENFPIIREDGKGYEQFYAPAEGVAAPITVSINLQLEKSGPDLGSFRKIFDTIEAWSLYVDSQSKFISYSPPTLQKELGWLARIGPEQDKVEVYCGSEWIKQAPDGRVIVSPVRYPLDQILLVNLLFGKGLLVHGAGMIIDNKGYIFAGPSGAGKSTICGLFKGGRNIAILSDDRIVIEKIGHEFLMFGTPWPGDAGIAVNDCARLYGIFFLSHSQDNSLKELRSGKALTNLFKVTSLPWYDKEDLQESFDLCEDLLQDVKMFELNFRPGPEIIDEIISYISG